MSDNQRPLTDEEIGLGKSVASGLAAKPTKTLSDSEIGLEPPARGFSGWGRDIAATAVKGAIAVPEVVVGLADIATGGRVGKFLENEGGSVGFRPKQAKEQVNDWHSDATKEAQRKFQEADGFVDKAVTAVQNPSLIATAVGESVPSMLAGGVAARGLMAATKLGQMGAKGAALAGAAGEGLTMAGSAAEQIRQETPDGLLTPTQAGLAAATGVIGAGLGAVGGRVAQKLGIGDAETMLAQGQKGLQQEMAQTSAKAAANPLVQQAVKGIPRQMIEGAISEGLLEELPQSVTEQVLQNIALGKDWHQDVDAAAVMGVLSGGAMGAGAAGFKGFSQPGAAAQPLDPGQPVADPASGTPPVAPDAGPMLALPAPQRKRPAPPDIGIVQVGPDGAARTPAYQAPDYVGGVTDVEPKPADPVREAVAAAAEQGGALSAAALTAIDSGASKAVQPVIPAPPEPAPISLEDADARDQAAYEQFFASLDAEPVVGRYFEDDTDIPDFDAASNASDEDFLRALGATDEDIQDAIATASQSQIPQSSPAVDAGAQADEPASPQEVAGADQAAQGQVGFLVGQKWGKPGRGQYTIESVSPDGRLAVADFGDGEKATISYDAESANGWAPIDAQPQEVSAAADSSQAAAEAPPATSAPTNLRDALSKIRADKAKETEGAAPVAGLNPAQNPGTPGVNPANPGVSAAAPAQDIKAITAKQIPDMTDGELQAAIQHYGPEHKRTAKLQKEVQRRAAQSPTPKGAVPNGPQASQAQQASPQPAQAGAAPAADAATQGSDPAPAADGASTVRALNDGAPTADAGAQAAPAPGAQTAAPAESKEQRGQRVAAAGEAWTRMPTVEREALAGRADGLNPIQRKRVPSAAWENLASTIQRKLADAMDARAETGGNATGTSMDAAQSAINSEAEKAGKIIGRNAEGLEIREDDRGVRSITRNGVQVSESVELRPMRAPNGGVTYGVARTELVPEFMTETERAEAAPADANIEEKPAVVPQEKQTGTSDSNAYKATDSGAKKAPASGKKGSADQTRAKADLMAALADLGDILGKNTRMNIMPEQEQKLLPVLTRLLDAAFRLGYHKFKDAAKFALDQIRANLGDDAADALTLDHLQGAYIAMAGGKQNADTKRAVIDVETKADIEAHEAVAVDDEPIDTAADQEENLTTPTDEQPEETTQTETLLGADNDTGTNAADDAGLLAGVPPSSSIEAGQGDAAGAGDGVREADTIRDGGSDSDRGGRGNRVDGVQEPVLPSTPTETRPLADSPVGKTTERPAVLAGENPGNFVITEEFGLGAGTDGQKINANMQALRTMRALQAENRFPTKDEQAVMARYVGWGGLKTVFDPKKATATDVYGRAQRELKEMLSDAEYRAAAQSIRNAHYTAKGVVDAMWRAARMMGFKGGRVLEPTVGIGNFIGLMPADMAASSQWHASELDAVTGQMAAMLYPEANVLAATGFQDAPFADEAFDLAIGNPPFGSQPIEDKTQRRKHLSGMKVHNYIIAKTGMHLRPGGVMSMVVTHRFLDTANPEARNVLAKDFRFLGAFRLPNNAFADNAGTEVVTDVVFLQKLRPDEARERDAAWLDINGEIEVDGQKIRVNRYYQENPSHILGRSAMDGTMYAGRKTDGEGEYTVHGDGRNLGKAIDDLLSGSLSSMAGALEQTNADRSAAPAMLQQSDLPVGGVMLDGEGRVMRRNMDDAAGNAVVEEITPETLWKEQAAEWELLRDTILAVKAKADAGRPLTAGDASEVLELARFTYKADGGPKASPTKADQAVYTLVDALAKPAAFTWKYDEELTAITSALNRKKLGDGGYQSLKGMLDLRNRTLALIRAEMTDAPNIEALRSELNKAYEAFVARHGFISDPANANLLEGDVGVESGLEASFQPAISKVVAKASGQPERKASSAKADILQRRVNFPYKEITTADSPADALNVSLSERGRVDLEYMAKLVGKSVKDVVDDLTSGANPQLFLDPETGTYQDAERYLSGNVKHKLDVARRAGAKANVAALEKAQPQPKTRGQVTPNIRGMWMPESVFSDFLAAMGGTNIKITAIPSQGILSADANFNNLTDFGVQFRNPHRTPVDMFNAAAAGKSIAIMAKNPDGSSYKLEEATKTVNAQVERMAKVFSEWAYSDEGRAKAIVDAFNEKMNTHIPRTYDGTKYLKPVGASPSVSLRKTQKNAAWRMIQEQNMLADHVVGAGKTFTLITGIMERRRLGLSRKPMVAVPNHLVVQWARDFYKLYPGAKVLAATPADFAKKNRRRLFARIATGDYDAVIVGHSSLGFIETPRADIEAIVTEKLKALRESLETARLNKESKRTLGQIEDRIDRYETKLKDLQDRATDDIGIDFKALGVDYLAVDEAHEFKNLEYSTSGERVVGMNDPKGSKKAFDLYAKIRGLQSRGGGVTFATGTPVSNSLVEIYTVMSYLAHDELLLRGQEHFDAWSGAYVATETKLEYTTTQKLKPRRVLSGLSNLSALRQLYEQFADIITMGDLKRIYAEEVAEKNSKNGTNERTEFPVPKVADGGRVLDSGDITPAQQEYMDYLVARMDAIEANKRDKTYAAIDNALNVMTDGRKMSLDIRIVDPTAPRDENGKVMRAARSIKDIYDKWDADRGTQMVFCDLSTPAKTAQKDANKLINDTLAKLFGKDGIKAAKRRLDGVTFAKQWEALTERANELIESADISEEKRDDISAYMAEIEDAEATMSVADVGFSVYDDLKTVLTDMGIPESEVAFIHDYNTPADKEKLFTRMNEGYVRVLIGSSAKMGAGTNAQRRLVALHHMDAPWRPSDVEQREGRIIRQGNMFYGRDPDGFEVTIRAYSTNNTSDTVMWQILERKAGAIEQFRNGGLDSVTEEGGDSDQYAEFMAASTGNPVFRQKLEAERRLTEIEAEIGGALIAASNARAFVGSYPDRLRKAQARAEAFAKVDASTLSFGGIQGTEAELEAAMARANQDYAEKLQRFEVRKVEAQAELTTWEMLPEATRGKKPPMPTAPSRPNLLSKSIQEQSAYARAVAQALKESSVGRQVRISLGGGAAVTIDGDPAVSGKVWRATLTVDGERKTIAVSTAELAIDGANLIAALTPSNLREEARWEAEIAKSDVQSLNSRLPVEKRRADVGVDTTKRDAAAAELDWYKVQVAFAEMEADIARSGRDNRYIARDRRRPLAASKTNAKRGDPQLFEKDGERYVTNGLSTYVMGFSGNGYFNQATRESDGAEVLLQRGTADATEFKVMEAPGAAKPAVSTNTKQTGAPEANVFDVLYSSKDSAAPARPLSLDRVNQLVQEALAGIRGAPPVEVTADPADIGLRVPAGSVGYGVTLRSGDIYVFQSAMGSDLDVFKTVFHELFHRGVRVLVPKSQYVQTMLDLAKGDTRIQRLAIEWKDTEMGQKQKDSLREQGYAGSELTAQYEALAIEEALAAVAEEIKAEGKLGSKPKSMTIRFLANWLAKIADLAGMKKLAQGIRNMTYNEAERFVMSAIDRSGEPVPRSGTANARSKAVEEGANYRSADLRSLKTSALDQIHQTLTHPGKVSLWDKTVGTMRHLGERAPAFKPVFEAAQRFIDDVSTLANETADAAPRLLPRVETLGDLKKKPITAADNKAIARPLFEGTLMWGRDTDGKAVLVDDLSKKYANLPAAKKAQMLLATGRIQEGVLKMWQGLPLEQYENLVNSRFESQMLKAGVVWTDAELKDLFNATPEQISLYREARQAIDRSIDLTARADMLRVMGADYAAMRDAIMEAPTLNDAMLLATEALQADARENPDSADRLMAANNQVVKRYEDATGLQEQGYAPLSRFGRYTVDVVSPDGTREYFGMFESMREANEMKRRMEGAYPGATVTSGTMSQEAYKLFAGITPESLEMFGNMLGLQSDGNDARDKAFQEYIKLAKNNHSALKRLIHRQGIAGYSEDVGRVLASFVYSNARQAAGGLNAGTMENAIGAIPKEQGELKDVALGLQSYIRDPQEEGQAIRGMLFAQYLGGSIASAFVNMTQPFAVTMPYLSQFGGMRKASAQLARAVKDVGTKEFKGEPDLSEALRRAVEDGTVAPQEIHQLMAQARGTGSLRVGDGTKLGDARAAAANNWERVKVAWGQPFALAEQFNRRSTFIAAYRMAKEQGNQNPAEFARKAVLETQFLYSKANKARWARGAIGGTLMTFKTYSVSYLELLQRTWNAGKAGSPERAAGRRAVAWALVMLMLMGGAGGLPFMEDLDDLIDGIGQMMGYNVSAKQWRKELLRDVLGKELGDFLNNGVSGLPGVTIDVSGRLGMGNLVPGTGLLLNKQNRERDLLEVAGPAGDLVARGFTGARKFLTGDVGGAALEVSPSAVRNWAKGYDMATSGIYKDTKGYKVIDTTLDEAIAKFIGFQPRSVAEVQDSSSFMVRSRSFYTQTSSEIKAQWAKALFEKDQAALERVRERLDDWNRNNPDQKIVIKMPDVWKKVREMGKDRAERIADTSPKALREQMREIARENS